MNETLTKSDRTDVLHSSCIEFRDCELVIFFKGILEREKVIEELQALLRGLKPFLRVDIFGERGPDKQA